MSLGLVLNLCAANITDMIAGESTKSVESLGSQLCELKDSDQLFVGEGDPGGLQFIEGRTDHSGPGDLEQNAPFRARTEGRRSSNSTASPHQPGMLTVWEVLTDSTESIMIGPFKKKIQGIEKMTECQRATNDESW